MTTTQPMVAAAERVVGLYVGRADGMGSSWRAPACDMASLLTVDEVADAASIYKAARLCSSLKDSKAGECQLHKPAQPRPAAAAAVAVAAAGVGILVRSPGAAATSPRGSVDVCSSSTVAAVQRASSLSWNFVIVVVFLVVAVSSDHQHVQRIVKRCQENRPQVCEPMFLTL